MRTVRGLAALVGACLVCAQGADASEVVPSGRVRQLAAGDVKPAGERLLRDDGSGDLLLAWTDGRRVRASIRPDGGTFSRPRTVPGLRDAIADDSLTEPFFGPGGRLLWGWRPGGGEGETSRMLVATAPGAPVQTLATDPSSVALGPLSQEADIGPDGHAALALVSGAGLDVWLAGPDGRFGAPQRLAGAGRPVVRVGRGGATLVAWTARTACAGDPAASCEAVQAAVRPAGGAFGAPITLDEQSTRGSLSQLRAVVSSTGPVVWWRRRAPATTDSAIVLARGSFAGLGAGVVLPGTGEPQTDGRCPPGPPGASRIGHAQPQVAAVRSGATGGLLAMLSRDEGCGILLDELPIAADGTPGAARRLTPSPLARRDRDGDRFALLDSDGPRPVLVTESVAGKVAVARARCGTPFVAPAPAPLPSHARLGAFGLLRDGGLALAFSRPCGHGRRAADVVIRSVRGAWLAPVRVNRCGDPEPVLVDSTGRAVFVQSGGGLSTWSSAPVQRYAHARRGGGSQRSGR
jgi:hypothetical protein